MICCCLQLRFRPHDAVRVVIVTLKLQCPGGWCNNTWWLSGQVYVCVHMSVHVILMHTRKRVRDTKAAWEMMEKQHTADPQTRKETY